MKIGIGIDTGGTCTDAVAYRFDGKEILAFGKAPTTKEDLSIGIGNALDQLPREYLESAEIIALSTTLATNACVENKGGRAKLIFFGVNPDSVARVGREYGLPANDSLIFIDSHTRPNGEIVKQPDWAYFKENIKDWLEECDAVGVVEMFAHKSGAVLEKQAREYIKEVLDIPVVCGHSLFSESNIIKRGASALLNARLISVIEEFLKAVSKALKDRGIAAPIVIVRSDGSLMSSAFTANRPVETLLCGPVASVMGAAELTDAKNCIVVDMGGTTTDIAFVKNGKPQRVNGGIRIGGWSTFVKGLFVDTFGLGGDSGVALTAERELTLEEEKAIPLCMAAEKWPSLLEHLRRRAQDTDRLITPQQNIYVKVRESNKNGYTHLETQLIDWLSEPHSLEELKKLHSQVIMPSHLTRLLREGIVMRCGVTPTDAMHIKGDFTKYCAEASRLGLEVMGRKLGASVNELCDSIYDMVKGKLYRNIIRILAEDAFPALREDGSSLRILAEDAYRRAKEGGSSQFFNCRFSTEAKLVVIGAPTKLFLEDVGILLGTKVITSPYSPVANALGAVVGKASATASMEVSYMVDEDIYVVSGHGIRQIFDTKEQAEGTADRLAHEQAIKEAIERGADPHRIDVELETNRNTFEAEYGTVYIGYTATATAAGELGLNRI
ncbi:MAG: hydantoinase/oxoprolinase family protein [Christensenellales bacterium]